MGQKGFPGKFGPEGVKVRAQVCTQTVRHKHAMTAQMHTWTYLLFQGEQGDTGKAGPMGERVSVICDV